MFCTRDDGKRLHVHLDEGSGINLISEQALEKVRERGIIVTETTALAVPLSIRAANETPLEGGRYFVRLPIVFHLEGGTQTIISVQFNIVERLNGSGMLLGSAFSGLGGQCEVAERQDEGIRRHGGEASRRTAPLGQEGGHPLTHLRGPPGRGGACY